MILASALATSVFLTYSHLVTFALPSFPRGNPALALSLSSPSVNFHMNANDLANSTPKTSTFGINVQTNNQTGYTLSLSNSDEDTSLRGSNATNTTTFSSISTSIASPSAFLPNT